MGLAPFLASPGWWPLALGQKVCKTAELKLVSVTKQEGISSHLNFNSLG